MAKIVLDKKGVRELLRSQEMMDICLEHAEATKTAAGSEGYEILMKLNMYSLVKVAVVDLILQTRPLFLFNRIRLQNIKHLYSMKK